MPDVNRRKKIYKARKGGRRAGKMREEENIRDGGKGENKTDTEMGKGGREREKKKSYEAGEVGERGEKGFEEKTYNRKRGDRGSKRKHPKGGEGKGGK